MCLVHIIQSTFVVSSPLLQAPYLAAFRSTSHVWRAAKERRRVSSLGGRGGNRGPAEQHGSQPSTKAAALISEPMTGIAAHVRKESLCNKVELGVTALVASFPCDSHHPIGGLFRLVWRLFGPFPEPIFRCIPVDQQVRFRLYHCSSSLFFTSSF